MSLPDQARREVVLHTALSDFKANPVYFFDTSFLLKTIASLAGWNAARLEAAIAPRIEQKITRADIRLAVPNGFYILFADPDPKAARHVAAQISADLFRHFYGEASFSQHDVDTFCSKSSTQMLAGQLTPPAAELPASNEKDGEKEELLLAQELRESFRGATDNRFLFCPCWDHVKSRLTSFFCQPDEATALRMNGADRGGLPLATELCKLDAAALGAATNGVRQIRLRGDAALVSVPIHMETLSWSKTRSAYLELLGRTDASLLALLAPRIVGLNAGANFDTLAQRITALRRYVRWTFVHLPSVPLDFSRAIALGATGFGLSISRLSPPKTRLATLSTEAEALRRICLAQKNAIGYADNVSSVEELMILKRHCFRVVSGPLIGAPEEEPPALRAVPPEPRRAAHR